ncbi:MAG: YqgE/AlgH family protein [Actinomycetota bacterium]|nr:YqgE/AlgH family protein [Actinomycetota bacterium]MDH4352572.1 YqgE/AlgH family protein [Actinomycetota bacterium]MDH5278240.1 YqgE/AlgH family protein [Actinomycetota bacterium]
MTEASLTGSLLVATPSLVDPSFNRTVVLLVDHDEDGALGVVLNRPTRVDVSEILPGWQDPASQPGVVFHGGPVGRDSALAIAVLASPVQDGEEPLGFRHVYGLLGLIDLDAPPEILLPEIRGLRVFAGYAGWGAGQLEDELAEQSWYVVPSTPDDVVATSPGDLWRDVLRRQGGELAMVATYPEDPSLN